jgi:hypothetical protein
MIGVSLRQARAERSIFAHMGLWRDVEFFCGVCQAWVPSGEATTRAGFVARKASRDSVPLVSLHCGHTVSTIDAEARLGDEIEHAEAAPTQHPDRSTTPRGPGRGLQTEPLA